MSVLVNKDSNITFINNQVTDNKVINIECLNSRWNNLTPCKNQRHGLRYYFYLRKRHGEIS